MDETSSVLEANGSSGLVKFWEQFSIFPSRFDKFCFEYWHVLIILYILFLLILDLVLDLRRGIVLAVVFNHSGIYYNHVLSFAKFDITDWLLISEGVALVLVAQAFTVWRQNITFTFRMLCERERICTIDKSNDLQQEYLQFLKVYQAVLKSRKRYILVAILMAIVLLLILIIIMPRISTIVSSLKDDPFYLFVFIVRWPLLLIIVCGLVIAYYVASGCWMMGITGFYIHRLASSFEFDLQPSHPDGCGGLKFLGDFCFRMALPILVAAVFLGIYGIGVALSSGVSLFVIAANLFLFLVALPMAAIAFFVPLWSIHSDMLKKRREYEDSFSDSKTSLEMKLHSLLLEGKLEEAKIVKDEIDLLQVLHPDQIDYPTWPLDRRTLFRFFTPQLIPLLSLIVSSNIKGPVADFLKALASIISGHPSP